MKKYTITVRKNGEELERLENMSAEQTVRIIERWTIGEVQLSKRLARLLVDDELMFIADQDDAAILRFKLENKEVK